MAKIWNALFKSQEALKSETRMTVDDWAEQYFTYQGLGYPIMGMNKVSESSEAPPTDFPSYVNQAYKTNGIVFACILARQLIFSEARFGYQRLRDGRPGDLFFPKELKILERPWPNGTTGELLNRAIQDADLAGNHYVVREGSRLRRLRPDWVEIILTAPPDEAVKSDVAGYLYKPGGTQNKDLWELYPIDGSRGVIAHWAPIPDPEAQYRGMSWLTPVLREIMADKAATTHKGKFFENAATPNLAVSLKETVSQEEFKAFMESMDSSHQGVQNAYETLYLGGGADVKVVGADLRQMDFKVTQGAGETRIAAAARIHPVIVGLSEGMQGSSLNAGNFKAAKDAFADSTMRPLWRSICASYEPLLRVPGDARLWFDDRDIAFLRQDRTDLAEIQAKEASTIAKLVQDGFTAQSVVEATIKQDWSLLKHTGLFSVQLQPPINKFGMPSSDTDGDGKPDVKPGQPQQVAQPKAPTTPNPAAAKPAATAPAKKPAPKPKPPAK